LSNGQQRSSRAGFKAACRAAALNRAAPLEQDALPLSSHAAFLMPLALMRERAVPGAGRSVTECRRTICRDTTTLAIWNVT
jgi:hypothetical protein